MIRYACGEFEWGFDSLHYKVDIMIGMIISH